MGVQQYDRSGGHQNVFSVNPGAEYATVAAGSTDQAIGGSEGGDTGSGVIGDYLSHVIIVPAASAAGAVSIRDGSGPALSLFAGGGTTALTSLAPLVVFLGLRSRSGAWKVTTGANVSAIAVGQFA